MRNIEDTLWHHVVMTHEPGAVNFYIDNTFIGTRALPASQVLMDYTGRLTVGAVYPGNQQFSGYMQDVRIYTRKLSKDEISELYHMPARQDVTPISGYATYMEGQRDGRIDVAAVQDTDEESNEVFTIRLLQGKGGATVSEVDSSAILTVLKSDNANGLFYFPDQCQPSQPITESASVMCTVARQRGDDGRVIVTWAVYQIIGSQAVIAADDFVEYTGQIVFEAGERSKPFTVQLKVDNQPEGEEVFEVRLTNTSTEDGVGGSTNTSGASIDPTNSASTITMRENDFPNGLLEFKADGVPPLPGDPFLPPLEERPTVRVKEEGGIARLLVVRAMGFQGAVTVEWRTTDGSAKSSGKTPIDYSAAVGRLTFRDGERYNFIDIRIIDNNIPEDEKSFIVTLLNPSGGATLGQGSAVIVVIEHSDGAFGVFQFGPMFRGIQAQESGDSGFNVVPLQIERTGGSIGQSVVSWMVQSDKNNDLVDHAGNVTFTHGQLTSDLQLKVRGDTVPELDELFVVIITAVSRGELGEASALRSEVTVQANNDPYGKFVFPTDMRPVFVDETNQLVRLEVRRVGGTFGAVEVNYTTLAPTETYPYIPSAIPRADYTDFQATTGSLRFAAGQEVATFDLQILDDLEPEEDEAVFVRLSGVRLLDAAQIRPVDNSPRLGTDTDSFGQVIINYNDNANGELVLSPLSPSVYENQTEPFLFITRYGGAFGEVTVTFKVTDGTALSGIDFLVLFNSVTLKRGETSAPLPLRVIDDTLPEVAEMFSVQLDQVSGGGVLGSVTSATIIIHASDDPNGAFEFSAPGMSIEEPQNVPLAVNLTVIRTGGTLGVMSLDWTAMIAGSMASDDVSPASGSIHFVSNEASRQITISVLPDDIPEGQEDVKISLVSVTEGGRIGARGVFTLSILSNDNPHGVVQFAMEAYDVLEGPTNTQQNIQVLRTGGSYGQLQVYYSTGPVMFVLEDVSSMGERVLTYFQGPVFGGRGVMGIPIPLEENIDYSVTCAEACLARIACLAFEVYMFNETGTCTLFETTTSDPLAISSTSIQYYEKDFVKAGELTGVRATPGDDYGVVTNGYILIDEGVTEGQLPIMIITDNIPELDEMFLLTLTRVDVTGATPSPQNSPYLGDLRNATVTIQANDDTYGAFTVYSDSPLATDEGHLIQVEERQNYAVDLIVERQGGTIGLVSVMWSVDRTASTAVYGVDYRADGAILTFNPGESRKLISVTILDDTMPELVKTVVVRLSAPTGGATINYDNATISIMENDNVAGVLSLTSTSLPAKEGDTISVDVVRSPSQFGTVNVDWSIQGLNGLDPAGGFQTYEGTLQFLPGVERKTIVLDVLTDNIPEVNEEYELHLVNIRTTGVGVSGSATLDPQLRTASITIQGSNNPHGVLQFSSNSLNVRVNEASGSVNVQLDRKFGAIGNIRVEYEITAGSLSQTNDELIYASANEDFAAERTFVDLVEGVSSAAITVTIMEDEIPEVDEVFVVRLLSVTLINEQASGEPPVLGSTGTVSQVIINANDGTKGEVIFKQDSVNVLVDETTSRNITLNVERTRGTFGDVSVFFYAQSVVEGTNLGLDYKITPEEIVFLNGETSKQILIEIIDDEIPEPDETFEVILSNAKNGLRLGTPSRATVTILANDDPAGFVYLESVDLITLDEPLRDGSLKSSVNIAVSRGPGMYGQVNVPFEVIPELEENRDDLSPMQGSITFENKQTSVMLTLSVLDDEIPEDTERFTLRLLTPDNTAQLGTKTERTIIVNANDSPNGLFSLYAAGTRMREISVEEGVGMLHFDIVRTQGMEGLVTVDMATEPGTAETMADVLSVHLVPVQVIPTTYVEDWYSYMVNGTVYLLMMKPSVVGELTSDMGSDGSQGPVDMATLLYTTLFRWQGELTPVQTVETDGVSGAESFVINGVQYLMVVNKGNHNRYETVSRLYRINTDGSLTLLQNLDTKGATDIAYFTKNTIHYIVIANSQDNSGNTRVDSDVWRWEPGNKRFSKVSTLKTVGAQAVEVVDIDGNLFLAVANYYDSVDKTYQVDSKVYKFDTSGQFSQHQSLPTLGAIDVEHTKIRSLDILIIANNRDNTVSSPQKSDVYRWDVTQLGFVLHERLETNRVQDVEIFTAFDDTVYAVFSNTISSSVMYAWDIQNIRFQSAWTGSPALSMQPITIKQGTNQMDLVAVANKNITTNPTLYQLVKVKDSDFAPRTVTMTMDENEDLLHATVYVFQDTIPEDTETFYVTLRNSGGGAEIGLDNRIAVNILSNDNAHGVIEIAPDSIELQTQELVDRDNTVQVNVIRHGGFFGHVTVKWVATGDHDGTNDITPLEGIVEFATGQAVSTVSLTVRDDDVAELQEVTYIQLTQIVETGTSLPGRGAVIGANKTAMVIVLANDSPYGVVRWEKSTITVQEPEGSDATIILNIVREQGLTGDLQVTYITSVDGRLTSSEQAVSGEDFISRQGMVILQENVSKVPVEVVIKQDSLPEAAEMFLVNITGVVLLGNVPPPGAEPSVRIPGNIVAVTIAENDNARGIVQFNVTTNIEGRIDVYEEFGLNTTIPLTVSRTVGFHGQVTVTWQAEPREATILDFSPSSGTLILADTQQSANIYVTVVDDSIPENMETFDIELISVTGGALLGPVSSVRIAILKNDSPNGLFRFVSTQAVVRESLTPDDPDGEVRLIVERIQGSEGVVNVQWRLNAEAVYDFYEPHTGTLLFAQGEKTKSLSLRTRPDNILEGEEQFRVSLITADNNADISHTQGDARIRVLPDPGASGTISIMQEHRKVYIGEPGESSPNYAGQVQVVLTRGEGIYGDVSVSWAITPRDESAFLQVEGTVTIANLQKQAAITIQALDDTIPELRSIYTLQLSSATGGAILSSVTGATTADIVFVASDHPHGEFVFDLPQTTVTTEDRFSVSLPVIRRAGLNQQVFVTYKTWPGTAHELEDYFPKEGTLTFQHGQNQLFIDIQLKQDDIPEGLETFYLNLTSARLVDTSTNNYTIVDGLQLDQKPMIGTPGVKIIEIEKNDNAEGTIQFLDEAAQFKVTEDQGVAKIPLMRSGGNFGAVSVLYVVHNDTATEGLDFVGRQGEVSFSDGTRNATLDITIRNDPEMEYAETFSVELVSTTGGARLGVRKMMTVEIAKSDYPNGQFGFKGQPGIDTKIIMNNTAKMVQRMLTVERTGGLLGEQTVYWRIFGPNNPKSPLQSTNDIAFKSGNMELTSGTLKWADGQAGERTITLDIKPFSSWEIEKTFVIGLEKVEGSPATVGNGEVSPTMGSVSLTISKFGHPNGIVRFDGPAQLAREYEEPEGTGTLTVQFPLIRRQDTGTVGNIEVFWEVQGHQDEVADFQPRNGSVLVADEERTSSITLEILPDSVPELSETFRLAITQIVGGAEIDTQYNLSTFTIKFNDEPHGLFGIMPEYQAIVVDPVDLTRHVQLNITRYGGHFGNVILTFSIKYDIPQSGILLSLSDGTVTFGEGEGNKVVMVGIEGTGFLELGTTFSVKLVEVNYLGEGVTKPPQFRAGMTEAKVTVPFEAANSKVGFKTTLASVLEDTGTCSLTVRREGTYGTVNVSWQSGFPGGRVLAGFTEGTVLPASSSVIITHGVAEKNFTVELSAKLNTAELFAVHLPSPPSTTVPGGTRLIPELAMVRIEPYGLVRFAQNSTQPEVSEMYGKIYLQVLRVYGSEGKLEVRYTAEGISASPFDFNTIENHAVVMEPMQTSGLILVDIVQDHTPEQAEIFHVNLTAVEKFPTETKPSVSPRISYLYGGSVVTIKESNDPYGVLNMEPEHSEVAEIYQDVNITVKRTGGIFGSVSVLVRTVGGGEDWTSQIVSRPRAEGNDTITEVLGNRDRFTSAVGGTDYVVLDTKVDFKPGELEKNVIVTILADDMAEPAETVLVYLTQPTGGARIAAGEPDGGKKGYSVITIAQNDLSNGVIGFSADSMSVTADEDKSPVVSLKLARTDAFFGEVEISWLAKVSEDSTETEDVILASQLVRTAGTAICPGRKDVCLFNITLQNDDIPEEEHSFVVKLMSVKNDAKLNMEALTAQVTVAASDYIRGLVEFTIDSRSMIASNIDTVVRLGVQRVMGQDYRVEVGYRSLMMTSQQPQDGVTVYPALEGEDYTGQTGILVFEAGRQEIAYIDVTLTPFEASSNPYPKQFFLELRNPTNGASVNPDSSRASILIVEDRDVDIWDIIKGMPDRPLSNDQIRNVLVELDTALQVTDAVSDTEITLTEDVLEKIIEEGLDRPLPSTIINQVLSLLCKLLTPDKDDATRGRSQLAAILEDTAYMMVTGAVCPTPSPPDVLQLQCVHAKIVAGRWPLGKIQGFQYQGQRQDEFIIPSTIPDATTNDNSSCADFHFIEYNSEQWFQRSAEKQLLSNKVISFGLKGRPSSYSDYPAVYRIHSPDRRIATRQAQCVYFDLSVRTWVSPNEICEVTNDLDLGVDDFVGCSCRHLTHYAVQATTSDPGLVGYTVWFFISCFICMAGLLLAILAHHLCSISAMFAASLLMHMCFAAMATQICYVVAAYLSADEILVYTLGEDNYRCIVMGLFLHYFFLTQFSWMMTQAINFWKILIMNDEHTDRKYVLFFLLGWGLPVVIVAAFYTVTFNLYKYVYDMPYDFIYGDINNNGDMCFITNAYAGLAGVILPVLLMLVVVAVVFVKAFQVTPQWQAYDDIYRGRYNISEVRTLLLFWGVIIITWLWGGLHLVYGQLWMLIMFAIFNILQGLMAVVAYALLRNPCLAGFLAPQRASSYSMTGHMFDPALSTHQGAGPPQGQYQFHPSTLDVGSLKGSRASLLNESWERDSLPSRGTRSTMKVKRTLPHSGNLYVDPPVYHQNTISDTKDFDDLLYALKTGGSFTPSDGSVISDRASDESSNIDKYELRRIDIADTHL
ncbi:adhesion G-protein coupled receptor V1-like [Mya arenaria]|uniref:adhesion G-protein coupled receptor V1-like n=1 Tax=Mya arenaria TaxID=6604 RepID=UPI0022E6C344|nr:adhesion G-protein coupled receptor V1-like [Mya arenaria]